MENKNKKMAVGYCRVSTDEQSKNGLSIEVQAEICRRAIEGDNYRVLKIIKDEGKSAGTLKREGIREIIRLVENQEIGAMYTIHSDRIARNTLDYLTLRKLFQEKGVIMKCINSPMSDDSAASLTMDTVMASFNEMQRLITSEKVKSTLYEKAGAGYFPATPPPGFKNIDNPDKNADRIAKKIVIKDPDSFYIMKELFKIYATSNYNGYDLCDIAFEKGLKSQRGGKVSPSRMYSLLRNRFYLGEVHWGPIHNKQGKHEPLVDKALFDMVQQILDSNNKHACRRRKYQWLLNGFLYCFKHERRYTAEWHKMKGGKKIAYYHCTHRSGCGKYAEQVELEDKIADKFKELEFAPEFVDKIISKAKRIFYERRKDYDRRRQGIVNQKTALEGRKKVMQDKLFDGLISDEDFTQSRKGVSEELDHLDEQLQKLEQGQEAKIDVAQEVLAFTRDIYKTYKKATPLVKRHYLGFFWKKFEIGDGIIIKSHPTLLFEELLKLQQAYYKDEENAKAKGANVSNGIIITSPRLRELDSNQRPIA